MNIRERLLLSGDGSTVEKPLADGAFGAHGRPALKGDGATEAALKLDCDRGPLEMFLRLDKGRLAEVRFDPAQGTVCPP